jgi:hypothetical protein
MLAVLMLLNGDYDGVAGFKLCRRAARAELKEHDLHILNIGKAMCILRRYSSHPSGHHRRRIKVTLARGSFEDCCRRALMEIPVETQA